MHIQDNAEELDADNPTSAAPKKGTGMVHDSLHDAQRERENSVATKSQRAATTDCRNAEIITPKCTNAPAATWNASSTDVSL